MALEFSLFKKKEDEDSSSSAMVPPPPSAPPSPAPFIPSGPAPQTPTAQVIALRNQGYPDDQIAQYLSRQFPPQQVYDAIAQSKQSREPSFRQDVVESIVNEKLGQVNKLVEGFSVWKDASEVRFAKIEQSIDDVKASMDSLHKALVAKLGDYDQHLMGVSADLKAMDKVFSQTIPELNVNIQKLSKVANSKET